MTTESLKPKTGRKIGFETGSDKTGINKALLEPPPIHMHAHKHVHADPKLKEDTLIYHDQDGKIIV